MPYGTVNADKMTTSDGVSSSGLYGFKNRILNGQMAIDQRNAGASFTVPSGGGYTLDRWSSQASQASKYTVQQSSTAPTGFANSLKITSSSAYSLAAGDYFQIQQSIEGYNTADLNWGSANAKTVTLSFWVQSSLTGTFGMFLVNNAGNRLYGTSYTINAANTWEQKTITITGDTSGTWETTNSTGIRIAWSLGYGSTYTGVTPNVWGNSGLYVPSGCVNVLGTNGATFYITGVQLEKGSTATSFDYRPYGTELQLCQRYLPAWRFDQSTNAYGFSGQAYSTTAALIILPFNVPARVKATGVVVSDPSHFGILNTAATALNAGSSVTYNQGSQYALMLGVAGASGVTAGSATLFAGTNTSGYIYATGCEL